MKKKLHLKSLFSLLFIVFLGSNSYAQSSAEVYGRIFEERTGEPLMGVSVQLMNETGIGTVTDREGRYRLQNLKPGQQKITFTYMGFQSDVREIELANNESLSLNIRMQESSEGLGEVIISSEYKRGQARALNLQKTAVNLKNVIDEEQIEKFPDLNVTEALKRVPGVVTEPQRGEAQSVMIRGLNSGFHIVNINGQRVASTEEGGRETNTAIIPIGMISSIEVVKTTTADMDADATSGAINMITTRAVGDKALIKATAAVGYNDMSGEPQYLGALTYSKKLGDFDLVLSGTYQNDNRATEDIRHDWGVEDFGNGPQDVLAGLRPSYYQTERERIGLGGQLDYNINDRSSLYFRGMYNRYDEFETRNDARYGVDNGTYTSEGLSEGARYEKVLRQYNRITDLTSLNAGGKHIIGESTIDYNFGYSHGTFEVPLREYYAFRHQEKPNYRYDISNRKFASLNVENDVDINDMEKMDFRYYERRRDDVTDTDMFANFNIQTPYLLGDGRGYFKFGGKAWRKSKKRNMTEQRWTGYEGGDLSMAEFYKPLDRNLVGGRYPINGNIDWDQGKQFFNENESSFVEDVNRSRENSDPNNFEAKEQIYAAYVMTDYTYGKFHANVGFRAEQVINDYKGNEVIFDENENYLRTEAIESDDISYFNLFPMMNLRYEIDRNTNLRFAFTQTIARPLFSDLVPYRLVNQDNQVIERGNPDLNPSKATNLDLLFETYFQNVGVLSGGLYYKNLKDFAYNESVFISDGGMYDGYLEVVPMNGESANIFGVEVAWQQKLDFLPGILSDFGVYANYTYSHSRAKILEPEERRIALPLQAPHVYNVALQYEKGGFSAQLSYNWRDTWLHSVGGSASAPSIQEMGDIYLDRYFESIGQLDFTASQKLNKNLSAYVNLNNLTNSSHRHYFGDPIYPYRDSYHSFWGYLGLRYEL